MSNLIELKVPDIGGHSNVDVIEVFIQPGQTVAVDDSLITLETDKATMEVPAEAAGVVKEVRAVLGGKISEGDVIAIIEVGASAAAPAPAAAVAAPVAAAPAPVAAPAPAAAPAAAANVGRSEIRIPDIGGHSGVDVIEVSVKVGDEIKVDDNLITLETDKATMEVPAEQAGVVKEVRTAVGGKISEGDVIVIIEAAGAASAANPAPAAAPAAAAPASAPAAAPVAAPVAASHAGAADIECDVLVLGAGPGGYSAAFRAADLGLKVVLVERYATLGGVCLNVGCIPSKALLHNAAVIDEVKHLAANGIKFAEPEIDIDMLRGYKEKVIGKLTGGLAAMAKMRKVTVVQGSGEFADPFHLKVVLAKDGTGRMTYRIALRYAPADLQLDALDVDRLRVRARRAGKGRGAVQHHAGTERPGRVLSRAQLVTGVWGHDSDIEERTVDVQVKRLRAAINSTGGKDLIRTVRSAGYSLG